jgi:antitoxin (DNA-binding transcriptional repressor) of toxin-antitoxin stability system
MCDGTEEPRVKTISAEEPELNCMEMIDLVGEKGVTFVVSKDGKPIARMMSVPPETEPRGASRDSETIL